MYVGWVCMYVRRVCIHHVCMCQGYLCMYKVSNVCMQGVRGLYVRKETSLLLTKMHGSLDCRDSDDWVSSWSTGISLTPGCVPAQNQHLPAMKTPQVPLFSQSKKQNKKVLQNHQHSLLRNSGPIHMQISQVSHLAPPLLFELS